MWVIILSLLVIILSPLTNAQTCEIAASAPTCVYCPSASSITIGGNAAVDTTISLGTSGFTSVANGASTGNVNICRTITGANSQFCRFGLYSDTVILGQYSTTVNVATDVVSAVNIATNTQATVSIGYTTPTPAPMQTQTLNLGRYSQYAKLGADSYQADLGTAAVYAHVGYGAQYASLGAAATVQIDVGSLTNAPIFIGRSTPTPSPTQDVAIARWSDVVEVANNAVRLNLGVSAARVFMGQDATTDIIIGAGTVPSIVIGRNTPTPTPTQVISMGQYAATINIAANAGSAVNVAVSTHAPVTIGLVSPTQSPSQAVVIASKSRDVNIANGAHTMNIGYSITNVFTIGYSAGAKIAIGEYNTGGIGLGEQSTATINIGRSSSAATQIVRVGHWSSSTEIGSNSVTVYLGHSATTLINIGEMSLAPITIGKSVPTPGPTQGRIKLQGLYHYYYSAMCDNDRVSGDTEVLICDATAGSSFGIQKNHVYSAGYGYDTATGRFYCPETGTYMVQVQILTASGSTNTHIGIVDHNAYNIVWGYSSPGVTMISIHSLWFCTAGASQYVRVKVYSGNLQDTGDTDNNFHRFTAYRIA